MNTPPEDVRSVLTELLRLYDWRNEIGRIERDFNHDKKQVTTWLNRYGREKKAAWEAARRVLSVVPSAVAARDVTYSSKVAPEARNEIIEGCAQAIEALMFKGTVTSTIAIAADAIRALKNLAPQSATGRSLNERRAWDADVLKDAERYRFLKSHFFEVQRPDPSDPDTIDKIPVSGGREMLDDVIDEAMRATDSRTEPK